MGGDLCRVPWVPFDLHGNNVNPLGLWFRWMFPDWWYIICTPTYSNLGDFFWVVYGYIFSRWFPHWRWPHGEPRPQPIASKCRAMPLPCSAKASPPSNDSEARGDSETIPEGEATSFDWKIHDISLGRKHQLQWKKTNTHTLFWGKTHIMCNVQLWSFRIPIRLLA